MTLSVDADENNAPRRCRRSADRAVQARAHYYYEPVV